MKLILFDIDGTLVRCGPQVGPIFCGALDQVFGGYGTIDGYQFAGKTDPQIVLDLVAASGVERESIHPRLPQMREIYHQRLSDGLERDKMRLLPGVVELLDRLMARDDIVLALLTGNWRDCASVKLSRFDLERYFPFGAFGDDGPDRCDLVPAALERAEAATGRRFAPEEALIVGDSVLDVECAHTTGLPCLAVATGFTSAKTLAQAGADWVYPDLVAASKSFPAFV